MRCKPVLFLLSTVSILFLSVGHKGSDEIIKTFKNWNSNLPEDRLYVMCDKPFYAPGETIWFTAFVRDGGSFKPSSKSDIVHVELINPKGSVERKLALIAKKGSAGGDFALSDDLPGGLYKLKAYTTWQKNDPTPAFFEKELQIQSVVLPRLKMKVDFVKKAYGPGDKVRAYFTAETNENKPLSTFSYRYVVSVAGNKILEKSGKTDKKGKATVSFDLPEKLASTDGLLNILLDYEGQTESISRSIPIVLNKIALTFFPEGGDLVIGFPSRVAFKAVNEFEKGADIEGVVLGGKTDTVARFASYHMGMGTFELTPRKGVTYQVRITRPAGIKTSYSLPEPLPRGYALSVKKRKRKSLQLAIGSTKSDGMRIFIQIRGKEYYSKVVNVKKGVTPLNVDITSFPAGVAQITLFDAKGIERAERLVFVNKHKRASIKISTNKKKYQPREKVSLTITAADEAGIRMPGHVALAVTDDQLLSFADDKSSTILSYMLAEADIRGKIEEPRFYFDDKEPKADKALELLMLTHGWRRFTWQQIRDNMKPAVSYDGERAVIAGTVIEGRTDKVVSGVSVQIEGSGIRAKTDKNGTFLFDNIDLYDPVTLIVKKGNMQNRQTIDRYNANLQMRLYKPMPRRKMQRARVKRAAMPPAPMAAAPVAEMDEAAPMGIMEGKKVAAKPRQRPPVAKGKALRQRPQAAKKDRIAPRKQKPPARLNKVKALKEEFAGIAADELLMDKEAVEQQPHVGYYRAREYAMPDYKDNNQPAIRSDFRSTIYWQGEVTLKKNGMAKVEFYTNDAITSFRATVEGFTADGGVGRGEQVFYSQSPFSVNVKIPPVVITRDTVRLPILIKNTTSKTVQGTLSYALPKGVRLVKKIKAQQTVKANASKVVPMKLYIASAGDSGSIRIAFEGGGFSDELVSPFKIIPQGFPVEQSFSGNELKNTFTVSIGNCVPRSLRVSFRAYPSVVSDLLTGIESILREPYGCFEQTSTSSYPNALVLSYLKSTDDQNQQIVDRAQALLEKGYKRLTTFETKENGYEWFGQSPGHEALTAYGLMQFHDMSTISDMVDKGMVQRTAKWLMSRRDNKGGFQRNPRALDSYGGADQDITNAYIVYALAEAGRRDIQKELDASVANARKSDDPYVCALVANALYCFQDTKRGNEILKSVVKKQASDGSWCGSRHSITRSGGISLKLETTALVCLAMMKSKQQYTAELTKGIQFIVGSRSGSGGFGATQSTILSLKALTAYAQYARKTDAPGTIVIAVDNQEVVRKKYPAGQREAIEIDSLEQFLAEGKRTATVTFVKTKQALPFSMSVAYNTWKPASSQECAVELTTKLAATRTKVGQTLRVTAVLKNKTSEGLPMTMAIVGLPAGLSPQPWQLKELQEKKVVDFYEVSGSEVVFYYRQMKPDERKTINLDCKAEIPGFYTAPASRGYLYYTNEYKVWTSLKPVSIQM